MRIVLVLLAAALAIYVASPSRPLTSVVPSPSATLPEDVAVSVEEGRRRIAEVDAERIGQAGGGSSQHQSLIAATHLAASEALISFEQYGTPLTRQIAQAKAVTNCGYRDGNWYQSIVSGASFSLATDPMYARLRAALTPIEIETGQAYLRDVADGAYNFIAASDHLKANCEAIAGAPFLYQLDALQIRLTAPLR